MKSIIICPYCRYKEEFFINDCVNVLKCKNCQKEMKADKNKGCVISQYSLNKCPFEE